MSSTNRGSTRRSADVYLTPAWCVHRLLEAVELPGTRWLEPSAGIGDIIRAAHPRHPGIEWTAVELHGECLPSLSEHADEVICPADFLELEFIGRFDGILTNPPFSSALPYIRASLEIADWVVMLLRLNFLGSARRNRFFRDQMPDVYILPNRPSFTGDGRTDSIEYAWFVWPPPAQRARRRGAVQVLATTPVRERRLRDSESSGDDVERGVRVATVQPGAPARIRLDDRPPTVVEHTDIDDGGPAG